jgi:hypothetical protein
LKIFYQDYFYVQASPVPTSLPPAGPTMVCSASAAASEYSSRRDAEPQTLGIQRQRIRKKRGLSRYYPYKAQSFDCIADLFRASCDELPALMLAKGPGGHLPSLRKFSCSLSSATFEPLPVATSANSTLTTREGDAAGLDASWVSLESELCTAFESQATFNVASSPVGEGEPESGSKINFGTMVETDR